MTAPAATPHRWVVLATFHAEGSPAVHVVDQLVEYRALGFEVLVVDTSPTVGVERRQVWERHATRWLQRPNVGYDFGSWQAGCALLVDELQVPVEALHLVLTNDSCFGPYLPLAEVFARLDATSVPPKTVFGITDSREMRRYHLQSYWLGFRPDTSAILIDFLARLPPPAHRGEAILGGELALSEHLERQGCRLVAFVSIDALMQRVASRPFGRLLAIAEFGVRRLLGRHRYTRGGDAACVKHLLRRPNALEFVNPTQDFGRYLHRQRASPFIKISLIRDNPNADRRLAPRTEVDGMTNPEASALLMAADAPARR